MNKELTLYAMYVKRISKDFNFIAPKYQTASIPNGFVDGAWEIVPILNKEDQERVWFTPGVFDPSYFQKNF